MAYKSRLLKKFKLIEVKINSKKFRKKLKHFDKSLDKFREIFEVLRGIDTNALEWC